MLFESIGFGLAPVGFGTESCEQKIELHLAMVDFLNRYVQLN